MPYPVCKLDLKREGLTEGYHSEGGMSVCNGMRDPCTKEGLQGYHDITPAVVLTLVPSEIDCLERFGRAAKELS